MRDLTFFDLLQAGEAGDTPMEVRLTARQFAAVQLVVSLGARTGVTGLAGAAALAAGVGESFRLSFREAEARLGFALAGVIAPERQAEFSAELARLDQERAASEGRN